MATNSRSSQERSLSLPGNSGFIIEVQQAVIAERDATILALQKRIDSYEAQFKMLVLNQRATANAMREEITNMLLEREERILGAVEDIHELIESAQLPQAQSSSPTKKRKTNTTAHFIPSCMCGDE